MRRVVVETDASAHVGGTTRRESKSLELKACGLIVEREASTPAIPITRIASRSVASRGIAPDRIIGVHDGFSNLGRPTIQGLPLIGGTFPGALRRRS